MQQCFVILKCGHRFVFLQCLKSVMCAQRLLFQMFHIWDMLCKCEMWSRNVWFQVLLCCEASSNSVIACVSYDQEVGPDKWEAVPVIVFSAVLYDSVIQCPRCLSNSANGKWNLWILSMIRMCSWIVSIFSSCHSYFRSVVKICSMKEFQKMWKCVHYSMW